LILKDTLRKIVKSHKSIVQRVASSEIVPRELKGTLNLELPHVVIITGIRRCGKSTLMYQIMQEVEAIRFFNFEDPKVVNFGISDFETLMSIFSDEENAANNSQRVICLDEIQNLEGWETLIRHYMDREQKFIITGSNAALLSKELSIKLTGRHIQYHLFPFSYSEFLLFKKLNVSLGSLESYMQLGGFPTYLKHESPEILQQLFLDIIARDVVIRHNLRSEKSIRELAVYLISNIGKEFSYTSLSKIFAISSVNTIISYIGYLEDCYLFFTVTKFDYSLKKQQINQKKVYCIDTALAQANSISFSEDMGRILENLVYLGIKRKFSEIYYFRRNGECDFVVLEKGKPRLVIQVCYELTEENLKREVNGLVEACKELRLNKGLIITLNQDDHLESDNITIEILRVWQWLPNI
jgi:uncharacterized protein